MTARAATDTRIGTELAHVLARVLLQIALARAGTRLEVPEPGIGVSQ